MTTLSPALHIPTKCLSCLQSNIPMGRLPLQPNRRAPSCLQNFVSITSTHKSSYTGLAVGRVYVMTDALAMLSPTRTKHGRSKEKAAQQTHGQASSLAAQIPLQAQGSSSVLDPAHPWVQSTLSSQHRDAHLSNRGRQCDCVPQRAFTPSSTRRMMV